MDDASQTVQTRTLARVLGMDVDYDGAGGVVRRVVTGSGIVLNVACLRPTDDFDESPRPCGKPTGGRRLDRRPPRPRPAGPAPGPAGGLKRTRNSAQLQRGAAHAPGPIPLPQF